jgi:hypothetical protein
LSSEYVATGRYDQTLGDFQFSLPTADDLREVFKRTVLQEMSEDLIVDEVPLRGTRVDVAVFDGSTFAFELKGPRDDVSRVRRQLRSYLRVFEYVSIVVDGHKVPRVPDRVGIIEVRRRSHQWEFETVKNAIENDKTDPVDQLSILTKRELLNLVRNMCGLESLSSRESMIRALTTTLGRAQINELFKDVMRTRVAKTNSPLAS